jgi:hypothetical protein
LPKQKEKKEQFRLNFNVITAFDSPAMPRLKVGRPSHDGARAAGTRPGSQAGRCQAVDSSLAQMLKVYLASHVTLFAEAELELLAVGRRALTRDSSSSFSAASGPGLALAAAVARACCQTEF